MKDPMGDRLKALERMEAGRRFLPTLPVMARLDGKAFSNYTSDLTRSPQVPYDEALTRCMIDTTKFLVEETCASVGYTQSDEITLAWYSPDYKSQIWFDGRIQKMCSVLAAMASSLFNQLALTRVVQRNAVSCYFDVCLTRPLAFFDCRVWQVPTLEEGANTFLWRERDAVKNSISMSARTLYSHEEIMDKTSSQMQEMLFQKGINWNDYPTFFKRGTYVQRKKIVKAMTMEEMEKIPERYRPSELVERTQVIELNLPPFSKVSNRPQVIFEGADPQHHVE